MYIEDTFSQSRQLNKYEVIRIEIGDNYFRLVDFRSLVMGIKTKKVFFFFSLGILFFRFWYLRSENFTLQNHIKSFV